MEVALCIQWVHLFITSMCFVQIVWGIMCPVMFDTIFEYMKVIVTLGKPYYRGGIATYSERDMKKPADYLAKMQLSIGGEGI